MLSQGPSGEQEASAAVAGDEKAGWSHSVRGWEISLQNLSLQATSKGEIETRPLRGQESHCGAARCVCLLQGGRGMVAELAAAELPGSQRKVL